MFAMLFDGIYGKSIDGKHPQISRLHEHKIGEFDIFVGAVCDWFLFVERRNYMVELLVGETEEIIHKTIVVVWWIPILYHLHLYTLLYTKQICNQNDGQDMKEKMYIAIAFICHMVWKPGNCREEISMYYSMTSKRWKRLRVVGISGPDVCKG